MLSKSSIGKYGRNLAVAAGVTLLGLGALPQAKASDFDKEVKMTFSAPVQIPGKVLPAGTYVFRRWSISGNPNAMLVMNADDRKPVGMVMYLPNSYANDAAPQWGAGGGDARSDVHVTFNETSPNTPQKVRAWNYPGDPASYELVYPEGTNAH